MAEVLPSEELVEEPSDYGSIQPGTRLGRYELLVPIARGGMARVWAARLHGQRGFQKLVAIKTILPHLAEEPEFERMFLDEARIASGVHHPNVCEIYELGEEQRILYLAMEWVSGDSLARVLRSTGKSEALDPRVVARIVADACAGLHAAHELTDDDGRALGVVHRDLSPHNILLTADGTAKVADFGVAKALGQLHEATSAGQIKGKIAYMAPEQITGAAIDRRSDVFSLGCVLYEATTGQRPFRGDGDHQVMHSVLKGELVAPTSFMRGYPQELERIVLRALSPQPILRYPTAERMRFALEEFVAKGQLVTQSNVAQVVRARIGDQIDRRKERIRQASTAGDGDAGWTEPPGNMTPSNQAHGGHRSGVKASGHHGAQRPLYTTMQMDRPQAQQQLAQLEAARAVAGGPMRTGSAEHRLGIPPSYPFAQNPGFTPSGAGVSRSGSFTPSGAGQGPTQGSHPGASYSHPHSQQHPYSHPQQPANPHAQTAMAVPPEMTGAGSVPPNTAQMRPFTIPPVSSVPPGPMQMPMHPGYAGHQGMGPMPFGADAGAVSQHQPFDPLANMPPAERPSAPPAGAGQYVVAIAVGVLLAVLIGVGGFFVWRSRHAHPVDAPVATGTAATGAPVASAAPAASGAAPTPVSVEIAFRVVPEGATLSVDGKDLPPDVRSIPRPEMGKTVTVVAHAKDHEDATTPVDFFTTSPAQLTLKPSAPPQAVAEPAADEAPSPPVAKDPPKKDPPRGDGSGRKPAGKGDSLPANPY